jgi:nucleoporin GLE1
VYREQLQKEERQRILDARRKEEERIRLEEELAADRARLNALKAKKIAIPPPLPEPEPAAAPTVNGKAPAAPTSANNAFAQTNGTTAQQAQQQQTIAPGPAPGAAVPKPTPASIPPQPQPQIQTPATVLNKPPEPAKPANSALGINGLLNNTPQPNGATATPGTSRSVAPPPAQARPDRYAEIHKNLKMLRKFMADQAKTNPALKGRMGDMRREIRKSVGQLTVTQGVAGVNKIQVGSPCLILTARFC